MAKVDAERARKKDAGREKAEPRRRVELIAATVAEIGQVGSLDVTVGRIARRAGMSPALAFHYFGDKETLFLAAMRHVLTIYGKDVTAALRASTGPEARVAAIVRSSFSPANFTPEAVAAWLNFYVLAQRSPGARRLLSIYRRRLVSNLAHALRPPLGDGARPAAIRLAGLVDGLYLRAVLDTETCGERAVENVIVALGQELAGTR